jgi:hypothetical protein
MRQIMELKRDEESKAAVVRMQTMKNKRSA